MFNYMQKSDWWIWNKKIIYVIGKPLNKNEYIIQTSSKIKRMSHKEFLSKPFCPIYNPSDRLIFDEDIRTYGAISDICPLLCLEDNGDICINDEYPQMSGLAGMAIATKYSKYTPEKYIVNQYFGALVIISGEYHHSSFFTKE